MVGHERGCDKNEYRFEKPWPVGQTPEVTSQQSGCDTSHPQTGHFRGLTGEV